MADFADNASELEALHLKASTAHRKPVPKRTGFCLNCGEETHGSFCSPECGEDYELRRSAKVRNG